VNHSYHRTATRHDGAAGASGAKLELVVYAVDLGQFTSLGLDPTRYTTVAVKSMQHFRAAFEPIAARFAGSF